MTDRCCVASAEKIPVSSFCNVSSGLSSSSPATDSSSIGVVFLLSLAESCTCCIRDKTSTEIFLSRFFSCSIKLGIISNDCNNNACFSGGTKSFLLINLLHKFSRPHANSPNNCAPAKRPLPFKVWNPRRTSIKLCQSC